MSDSIESWIKNEAKINLNVHNFEQEFSNGYYFGQIFFNFGLNPRFLEIYQNK